MFGCCSSRGCCVQEEKKEPIGPSEVDVTNFLNRNPEFLADYVQKFIHVEMIENWLLLRKKAAIHRKSSLAKWKFGVHANKKIMLHEMAITLNHHSPEESVIWEASLCISNAVSADSFRIFILSKNELSVQLLSETGNSIGRIEESIPVSGPNYSVMCRIIATEAAVRLSRKEVEEKFEKGLGNYGVEKPDAAYVLGYPILRADGKLFGVLELFRKDIGSPFMFEDEEIVNSYLVWGGISLHYAEMNKAMELQKAQHEFLLGVVRNIFMDMVSMDVIVKKVMGFAQTLVDADRASLFLVDTRTNEVFARLFDMGTKPNTPEESTTSASSTRGVYAQASKEISRFGKNMIMTLRFPMGVGIAGIVAKEGHNLNIIDAYNDSRFNRSIDQATGYVTKSILCMPIFIRGVVIGVVQMVNKKNGEYFTKEDEQAFETFALYCGLALHHAKLYDKIRKSEQKYKVALEVLSYHNTCSPEEFDQIKNNGYPKTIPHLDEFYFSPMAIDDFKKVQYGVYMFVDLFSKSPYLNLDLDSLFRFVLTVKKNYRIVPYHNWTHGFTVAHCMYVILKKPGEKKFHDLEAISMFTACLCHDLDHRGKNNKFMIETMSPLASIYGTSTLEHHHFNQTVMILQQDGHNILGKLGSEDYKRVLRNIKHCILATDLEMFFPNKAKLASIIENKSFVWSNAEQKMLLQAICMTAADLCASAKPWDIQVETVKVIFEEFYEQGDFEKRAGKAVIPMMDRDKIETQPSSQVGFINGICIPCYDLLQSIIPSTAPLLEGCKLNLAKWKTLAAEVEEKTRKNSGAMAKK